jgi:peroxiredoxin
MRVLRYKEPQRAKDFDAIDLKGQPRRFRDFHGKVILLNFWATWCGPCKKEMAPMEHLFQRFKQRGLTIVAVSLDQGGAKVVQSFVEKNGLTFPIVIDNLGKAKSTYHVTSLPTTFLIDEDGGIIAKSLGPRDWASESAFALIESLLTSNP